jgi:demethylmenaquinone methyltransferase/2-methoxy-6-polyprenyl-1,4-benzoquinol methylase
MTNNFLFDILAPLYDRVIGFDTTSQLIPLLNLDGTQRLLDAGGGTGRITEVIAPYAGETWIGDLSMPMLRQAQSKNMAVLTNTSTTALPFKSSSFERILVVDALHHFPEQQQTLVELWRILKPGGRLVIEEPNIHKFGVKLVALAEKLALMGSHFHTPEQIARMVGKFSDALVTLEMSSLNAAWIIADKQTEVMMVN